MLVTNVLLQFRRELGAVRRPVWPKLLAKGSLLVAHRARGRPLRCAVLIKHRLRLLSLVRGSKEQEAAKARGRVRAQVLRPQLWRLRQMNNTVQGSRSAVKALREREKAPGQELGKHKASDWTGPVLTTAAELEHLITQK